LGWCVQLTAQVNRDADIRVQLALYWWPRVNLPPNVGVDVKDEGHESPCSLGGGRTADDLCCGPGTERPLGRARRRGQGTAEQDGCQGECDREWLRKAALLPSSHPSPMTFGPNDGLPPTPPPTVLDGFQGQIFRR
jgi:hypothetical protein